MSNDDVEDTTSYQLTTDQIHTMLLRNIETTYLDWIRCGKMLANDSGSFGFEVETVKVAPRVGPEGFLLKLESKLDSRKLRHVLVDTPWIH
jgi:hypothetical protein